jgi:nucleoside diphosphate kinase
MVKPDAVIHGAAAAIIKAIEDDGFVIVGQIKRSLRR